MNTKKCGHLRVNVDNQFKHCTDQNISLKGADIDDISSWLIHIETRVTQSLIYKGKKGNRKRERGRRGKGPKSF